MFAQLINWCEKNVCLNNCNRRKMLTHFKFKKIKVQKKYVNRNKI